MLYVLTGIYWASISAARAPKGRFCPDFLSFVVQFWAKIVFSPNIGVWGVQIIATERPAHTSLLQPIWSHPAQGNGQKQAKKGSFWPKVPLLVALEVLGGPRGPDLVSTATGCSVCVGIMVTTHFWLILGLFWAAKDPKRDRFGPKCRFLAPWRSGTAWMECQQAQ